jgi:hypothetical protein
MKIRLFATLIFATLVSLNLTAQTKSTQPAKNTNKSTKGTQKTTDAPAPEPAHEAGGELPQADKDTLTAAAKMQASADALNSLTNQLGTALLIVGVLALALILALVAVFRSLSKLREQFKNLASPDNVTSAVDDVKKALTDLAKKADVTAGVTETKAALQTAIGDLARKTDVTDLRPVIVEVRTAVTEARAAFHTDLGDVNQRITESRSAIQEAIVSHHAQAHQTHQADPKKA